MNEIRWIIFAARLEKHIMYMWPRAVNELAYNPGSCLPHRDLNFLWYLSNGRGHCMSISFTVVYFNTDVIFDEHFLLSIISLFSHILVSVFYMSFGHRLSPREVMRDWLAYTEEDNCWEKAARAVRDYQLETPVRDHGYDSSRLHKSRTQTTGRPKRRLGKKANLEGEEEPS